MIDGFMDSGERLDSEYDAQVAAHDYAHEGWYFRIMHWDNRSGPQWGVLVKWGRRVRPACCKPRKRTFVAEATPAETWTPRSTEALRRKAREKVAA